MNRFVMEMIRDLQIMLFCLKISGQVQWPWWAVFAPAIFCVLAFGVTRIIEMRSIDRYWKENHD